MFLLERIIARIASSDYRDNFILKGGLLLSSIFGEDKRTTKDMDTTIKGIPLEKDVLIKILNKILSINLNDNAKFTIIGVEEIRDDDEYGGYRFNIEALFETIVAYLTIDITTGDKITPREVKYKYKSMFSDESYMIMSYPNETTIAEKFETIITKGESNTRGKDFYDLYMLMNLDIIKIDKDLLAEAITNTFKKRNGSNNLKLLFDIIEVIKLSEKLKLVWNNYRSQYYYAKDIEYKDIVKTLKIIIDLIIEKIKI
jgi:predicted nucleotidyltransferase component of viral defense system